MSINLLPEKEKKEVSLLNFYVALKNILFLILFGIIISSIILLSGKIILLRHLTEFISRYDTPLSFSQGEIQQFSKKMKSIESIQKEYVPWSRFLVRIQEIIPEGVTLESLHADSGGLLEMKIFAQDRDSVLSLQKNLRESGLFEEFTLPFDTLFSKDEIRFSLALKFNVGIITKNNEN